MKVRNLVTKTNFFKKAYYVFNIKVRFTNNRMSLVFIWRLYNEPSLAASSYI